MQSSKHPVREGIEEEKNDIYVDVYIYIYI